MTEHVLTRRRFMALSVGASAVVLSGAGSEVARDPHLTARPFPPFRTPEPGENHFGANLERGGFLFVPDGHTAPSPAPLIVALHGSGGRATTWRSLEESCTERGIVLLAPDSRDHTWDRVHGDFGPDVGFIDSALRYTFERCAIDPGRIALAGFSDGASYALSLGPSNGDLFTHIIAWSPGFSAPAYPVTGTPRVFISHGTADTSLPVALSRNSIVPTFEMDGYDIEYSEFDGRHEITDEVRQQALEWFLS